MLLLRKISVLVCMTMMLMSCGFTPVYKTDTGDKIIAPELKTITVAKINRGVQGVKLKAHLEDIFNPKGVDSWKHYVLSVTLEYRKDPLLIEQNRDINRYNIMMKGHFSLKDKALGKVVYSDVSRLTNGYRVVDSDFATLSSEEDTENRIIAEMAKDISFKISDYFLSQKQEAE